MPRFALIVLFGLSACLPVDASTAPAASPSAATHAAHYVSAPGSTLGFTSSYDGEAFSGRFSRFSADISFNPSTVQGRFDVRIELASASTANDERDDTLKGSDFFNAAAMPQARYTATRFQQLADGRFVAEGNLTLRGISKPVPLTFRWVPGASPVLDGVATVKRLAFGVGTGDWDDTEVLPDDVLVRTRLNLQPAR